MRGVERKPHTSAEVYFALLIGFKIDLLLIEVS